MTQPNDIQLLTTAEAARILRLCEATVQKLARTGQLPARKVGRAYRIDVATVQAWLRGGESQNTPR